MKMKIETYKGKTGVLEADTMPQMVEAGRQFCLAHGEGWPSDVLFWERVNEAPPQSTNNKGRNQK